MVDDSDAKIGTAIAVELVKAASDEPEVRKAGKNLGKTAAIVTETVNNVLLPLAVVNFAIAKAKSYFEGLFPKEIEQKASEIPPEHLTDPPPYVAGPALQGLAFTVEEAPLKEMFLNLLVAGMDDRKADLAHPAFVEVVRQLTSREAIKLESILGPVHQPIARLGLLSPREGSSTVIFEHVLNVRDAKKRPLLDSDLRADVDNWCRLGLVQVAYDSWLASEGAYDWVRDRPEFVQVEKLAKDGQTAQVVKGVLATNAFGLRFAKAVGIQK